MKDFIHLSEIAKKRFNVNNFSYYFSPGRVNLIGEHLDYNGGSVLPMAINLGIYAAFSPRDDNLVRLLSLSIDEDKIYSFKINDSTKENNWTDYVKAVIIAFNKPFLKGFDMIISSNLPIGAGLSSSASLELLVATFINEENKLKLNRLQLVQICKQAENDFIGLASGIMDQFTIAYGIKDHAILLNTQDLSYEYLRFSLDSYSLVIANTNKTRDLVDSNYNNREQEAKAALTILEKHYNINNLCELLLEDLEKIKLVLNDETLFRRVRHIVSEENRVKLASLALSKNEILNFAKLLSASHKSLQEDYEVSCYELDTMVELFENYGALGARMTGAGFGGCVIGLVRNDNLAFLLTRLYNDYYINTSLKPEFYVAKTSNQVCKVEVSLMKPINELLDYALKYDLFPKEEYHYRANSLINYFNELSFIKVESIKTDLDDILEDLYVFACIKKLINDSSLIIKNNFKANIMDLVILAPSIINTRFYELYKSSADKALNFLYNYSKASNYIRLKEINKNITWKYSSCYGVLDLTINMSKPEKDPLDIKKAAKLKSLSYPKCQLCLENEGFGGNLLKESRRNMRLVNLKLNNEEWYFQYSPYLYYEEHSILLSKSHHPMIINELSLIKLQEAVAMFPKYFVGSNADLAIVGGSILSHEHFQAGSQRLAIEDAKEDLVYENDKLRISKLFWPLSTIRLASKEANILIKQASKILSSWRKYENKELNINNSPLIHNTITPICRFREGEWIMDLILRNNFTTEASPLGIFHPRASLHHIKKENIGLIEAMGLAILPARLKDELKLIDIIIRKDTNILIDKALSKHKVWISELKKQYQKNKQDFNIYDEVGKKFTLVLEDAGVFKQNTKAQEHFISFIKSCI